MTFWSFSNFTLWISEFQLWPKTPLKLVIFPLWTKGFRFKKVFSNLEPEGQGYVIIKGVTSLLLLWPFYTIQINFVYYFAHDCTIVPSSHRIMMKIVRFYVMTLILTIYLLSFFRQCAAVSILFLPIMLPPQTCCPLNSLKVR